MCSLRYSGGCVNCYDGEMMNDFTKEELETIFLDMTHNILKYGKENVAPFYLDLRDKVESMIYNYCKHPSTNFDDGIYYCNECGYCVP